MNDTTPARTRTVSWTDPLAIANLARVKSGKEILEAIIRGDVDHPPFAHLLGLRLIEVGDGLAVFTVEPAEFHYNPIGVVHGGLLATALDSAMGCSVHSTLPQGTAYTTLEIKTNFVRPATMTTGPLRSEARVIHRGKTSATAEGKVVDASGRLYAHGTTTCLLIGG